MWVLPFLGCGLGFLTARCHHHSFGEQCYRCHHPGALEGPLLGVTWDCSLSSLQKVPASVFSAPADLSTQLNVLFPAGAKILFSPEKQAPDTFWLLTWLCGKHSPRSVIPFSCKWSSCKHNFHLFTEL